MLYRCNTHVPDNVALCYVLLVWLGVYIDLQISICCVGQSCTYLEEQICMAWPVRHRVQVYNFWWVNPVVVCAWIDLGD